MRCECTIDWFTGSMPPLAAKASWPTDIGRILTGYAKMCAGDPKPQPAKWQGYDGFKLQSLFWGERDDGAIINASSFAAELVATHNWRYIRPSRLDVQITLWLEDCAPLDWIGGVEAVLQRLYTERPRAKRKLTNYDTNMGGRTLYVGSEGSPKRIRIYDKGSESQDPYYAGAVRIELQCRHAVARAAYEKLAGFNDNWRDTAVAMVAGEMANAGYTLRGVGCTSAPIRTAANVRTTSDRRMRWLRAQVRPAIEKMLLDGYSIADVLAALDLA